MDDETYKTARQEYDQNPIKECDGKKSKRPSWVGHWGAIAKELYGKETAEVKNRVVEAVEEQVKNANILKEKLPIDEVDAEKRLAKLVL